MSRFSQLRDDHLSGGVVLIIGAFVAGIGLTYNMGSLSRMGAGFMPVVFGVLLILIGLAIAVTATDPEEKHETVGNERADRAGFHWRGPVCIMAGVASFVVLGSWGGLVPAVFVATFLAAMGDRTNTVRSAAVLAAAVDVFCVGVFHFGLQMQLPLFQWY